MPDFPAIGCGAIAQYPSSTEQWAPAVIQRYVDGSEQRVRRQSGVTRRWIVRLDRLSEGDAQTLMEFFESVRGRASGFRFQDPWTGVWHEECWFSGDALELEHLHEGRLRGEMSIQTREG